MTFIPSILNIDAGERKKERKEIKKLPFTADF